MQVRAWIAILGIGLVPTPSIVEYDIPTPNSAPHCLVAAPDGLIWFVEIGANKLGKFDPQTERSSNGPCRPRLAPARHRLGVGRPPVHHRAGREQDRRLRPKTERFTEYAVPSPGAGPHTPIQGPDGAIWFTEQRGNRIGRLDPATGKISEYPVPTPSANAYGIIASRRENAVYFAELEGHKLGRVDAKTGKIEEFPPRRRPRVSGGSRSTGAAGFG